MKIIEFHKIMIKFDYITQNLPRVKLKQREKKFAHYTHFLGPPHF